MLHPSLVGETVELDCYVGVQGVSYSWSKADKYSGSMDVNTVSSKCAKAARLKKLTLVTRAENVKNIKINLI